MPRYIPEPLLGGEDTLIEYIQRQFQLISLAFEGVDAIELPELHVEPSKPRAGVIVLADGTNWDPGSGRGFYGYSNGAWRFLG